MTESASERSRRLVEAAVLGIAGIAAIGLAAAGQRRPTKGLDHFGRPNALRRRRPPSARPELDGVPVRPDRPLNLSGGAAAALEFGD